MGPRAVWWLLLVASVSAIDLYHEVPPVDFDDYETDNDVDTSPYGMGPSYQDLEDWKRDLIFFQLLRAVQNNQGENYRNMEYDVEPSSMRNVLDTMDVKQPFVKRASNTKDKNKPKPKPKPAKAAPARSQPKSNAKKGKFFYCYFKICAFPRQTYKIY